MACSLALLLLPFALLAEFLPKLSNSGQEVWRLFDLRVQFVSVTVAVGFLDSFLRSFVAVRVVGSVGRRVCRLCWPLLGLWGAAEAQADQVRHDT